MEYQFYKTLEEVHSIYVELWKKGGLDLDVTINKQYNQLYVKDRTNNVTYTNNKLNSMRYSKTDLKILNTLNRVKNKGIRQRFNKKFIKDINEAIKKAIRQPIFDTPACDDYSIDQIIRKNVILPASVINYNNMKPKQEDSVGKYYDLHKDVYKLDENSCYFSALTKFGKIAIPKPELNILNDLPDRFENNKYYSFRVNLINPRIKNHDLFPMAQPSNLEDEGIETRGRFGTELDTTVENIEAVMNVYYKDDKLINDFTYLYDKYYYDDMEFVSGFYLDLTDDFIDWNSVMMKINFDILKTVKQENAKEESKLYAQIQQLLKTTLGVSFTSMPNPEDTLEVRLTVEDPFTVIQEERENKNPKKRSNHIWITPILYTIVNNHIRNWMNIVPYRFHIKGTADAMFITSEGFYRYVYNNPDLPIGLEVGKFKTSHGNLRSYDAKLWMMYDEEENIVDMAHGGIGKEVAEHLKTVKDWDNRNEIALKYAKTVYKLEDLFQFKRYINEINKEGYKNMYDYTSYQKYEGDYFGKIALLGGQGTGKTTAVVNALKETKLNVLHLFYNKYPAEQNKDVYDMGYKDVYGLKKEVRTIDSMIYKLYNKKEVGRPNYDNLRKAAINNPNNLLNYTAQFDVIVVDEIQSINGYNRKIILEVIRNAKNVILVGDFNQEWQKNYRNKKPFSMKDLEDNVDKFYKLDINYRNAKNIYNFGKKILDDNTKSGALSLGRSSFIKVQTYQELKDYVESYKFEENAIFVSRHSKVRRRIKNEFGIRAMSVSDTKSTSPETVILINSMKLGLHEKTNYKKEYDAVKEIWSAIMRPRTKLIILEYEGWT